MAASGEITGLADFLAAFDKAKGHMRQSEREFLLATREALSVFQRLGDQTGTDALGLPLHILRIVVAALDVMIAALPEEAPEEDVRKAKATAYNQLIVVLDDEIIRTMQSAADAADLAKVEALQSLIKYIQAELDRLTDESAASRQRRQRITRIDIE